LRGPQQQRRGGVEPHRLLYDPPRGRQRREAVRVQHARRRHGGDLVQHLRLDCRVPRQEEQHPGEGARRRLVPGGDEGEQVVQQLGLGEGASAFRVDVGAQQAQQPGVRVGSVAAPRVAAPRVAAQYVQDHAAQLLRRPHADAAAGVGEPVRRQQQAERQVPTALLKVGEERVAEVRPVDRLGAWQQRAQDDVERRAHHLRRYVHRLPRPCRPAVAGGFGGGCHERQQPQRRLVAERRGGRPALVTPARPVGRQHPVAQ